MYLPSGPASSAKNDVAPDARASSPASRRMRATSCSLASLLQRMSKQRKSGVRRMRPSAASRPIIRKISVSPIGDMRLRSVMLRGVTERSETPIRAAAFFARSATRPRPVIARMPRTISSKPPKLPGSPPSATISCCSALRSMRLTIVGPNSARAPATSGSRGSSASASASPLPEKRVPSAGDRCRSRRRFRSSSRVDPSVPQANTSTGALTSPLVPYCRSRKLARHEPPPPEGESIRSTSCSGKTSAPCASARAT